MLLRQCEGSWILWGSFGLRRHPCGKQTCFPLLQDKPKLGHWVYFSVIALLGHVRSPNAIRTLFWLCAELSEVHRDNTSTHGIHKLQKASWTWPENISHYIQEFSSRNSGEAQPPITACTWSTWSCVSSVAGANLGGPRLGDQNWEGS